MNDYVFDDCLHRGHFIFIKMFMDRDFIWFCFYYHFDVCYVFETDYLDHVPESGRLIIFTFSFLVIYAMVLVYNRYFRKEGCKE